MHITPIGHIESPYLTKFGVPRQPGVVDTVCSSIVLNKAHGLSLGAGSRIIVLWAFSHNVSEEGNWSRTVRPPRLGGNTRMGVFATRSSFRPNNLALSCVKVIDASSKRIEIIGGDMVDGTPVYALYSYELEKHRFLLASGGWPAQTDWPELDEVVIDEENACILDEEISNGLIQVLKQDPRPAYTRNDYEEREYWTVFGSCALWFTVQDTVLRVTRAHRLSDEEIDQLKASGTLDDELFSRSV